MKKKTSHGGSRKRAGRKALGRIKTLVSFAPDTLKELRQRAEARNVPLGYVIDGLVNPEGRSA